MGFLFTLIAVTMWASFPIAVQQVLTDMDPQTIAWYRFAVATFVIFILLIKNNKLPHLGQLKGKTLLFLLIATLGLGLNFFFYHLALRYIPPVTSQILSPLSSFMMLLAGVVLFKERLSFYQKIGLLCLVIGLAIFFNDKLENFLTFDLYFQGILLAICASALWVTYAISQKLLQHKLEAQQTLLIIYLGCTLFFTPVAEIGQIKALNNAQLGYLFFCCINTLLAYGCYAEALNRWEVSKVSALITQIPVFTILFANGLFYFFPEHFTDQQVNALSYVGAAIVIFGSLTSAVGHKLFRKVAK
ncbi:EamA domain-containing membrane protein RarD [Volucribacter psittacicida]|uniref:EamA domain-containing membrane protein RarD n=1 Tax=Volucribacter psittacicida TaxID=203482 RepID=A0A4R1FUC5_9PAST|nr:DMT family transporter [Volucribacter psittacicida]TCJ96118.1 EamA domain-containing membrane protein RarD [Volucribacter psittacicida]